MAMYYEGFATLSEIYGRRAFDFIILNDINQYTQILKQISTSEKDSTLLSLLDGLIERSIEYNRPKFITAFADVFPQYKDRIFKYIKKPGFWNFPMKKVLNKLLSDYKKNDFYISFYTQNNSFDIKFFQYLNSKICKNISTEKEKNNYSEDLLNTFFYCAEVGRNKIEDIYVNLKNNKYFNISGALNFSINNETPLSLTMRNNDIINFSKIYSLFSLHSVKHYVNSENDKATNFHSLLSLKFEDNHMEMLDILLNEEAFNLTKINNKGQHCLFSIFKNLYYKYSPDFFLLYEKIVNLNILDINHQDNLGNTCLNYAVLLKNYKAAQILLNKKANPHIVNKLGFNSFNLCLINADFYWNTFTSKDEKSAFYLTRDNSHQFYFNTPFISDLFNKYNPSKADLISSFEIVLKNRECQNSDDIRHNLEHIIYLLKRNNENYSFNQDTANLFWKALKFLDNSNNNQYKTGFWFMEHSLDAKFPENRHSFDESYLKIFIDYEKHIINNSILLEQDNEIVQKSSMIKRRL